MAAKNKTTFTDVSVTDFINSFVEKEQKRADSFRLVELMQKWSGFKPQMYGPTIIGFGRYRYTYSSGHEGEAPLLGFSPRKANLSLHLTIDIKKHADALSKLGKHKTGVGCLYINKLEDVDLKVLEKMITASANK